MPLTLSCLLLETNGISTVLVHGVRDKFDHIYEKKSGVKFKMKPTCHPFEAGLYN